jgi:cystathionine beta-lyase
VLAFPDVMRGIEVTLRLGCRPGAPVIVTTPIYPPFLRSVDEGRHSLAECPLVERDGEWGLDLDRIDAALASGAGAVLLCNPHNPTGQVFGRSELIALAGIVKERGALLIADEIHAPIVYERTHCSIATLDPEVAEQTVTLLGASKGWNLPGLRCAVAVVGSPALGNAIIADGARALGGVSQLGIVATIAAFQHGGPWLADAIGQLRINRSLLAARIGADLPRVRWTPPLATYLAWLDCRALGLGDRPAGWFLDTARVALADGTEFGPPGRGFVRLSFATPPAILDDMVSRLAYACQALTPHGQA